MFTLFKNLHIKTNSLKKPYLYIYLIQIIGPNHNEYNAKNILFIWAKQASYKHVLKNQKQNLKSEINKNWIMLFVSTLLTIISYFSHLFTNIRVYLLYIYV